MYHLNNEDSFIIDTSPWQDERTVRVDIVEVVEMTCFYQTEPQEQTAEKPAGATHSAGLNCEFCSLVNTMGGTGPACSAGQTTHN